MPIGLITGAASGIGLSLVQLLNTKGWEIIAIDNNKNIENIYVNFNNIKTVVGDVSEDTMWLDFMDYCKKAYNKLDAIVNCAAILDDEDRGIETSSDIWVKVLKNNIIGTMNTCKYCVGLLANSNKATIVNVSSITALVGSSISQLAYTASKGAILSFSRELAIELSTKKIRVNVICPGLTDTPMTNKLLGGQDLRSQQIPLRRWASPTEIAKVISFLISEESSYITGSVIVVDGGITATNTTTKFIPLRQSL